MMIQIELYFLLFCIPSRGLLAYLVRTCSHRTRYLMAFILMCISVAFATIYLFGLRKTGAEVNGGEIWWDPLRVVHSALYMSAALYLIKNEKGYASGILIIDTMIGLIAHMLHRKYVSF